MIIKIDSIVLVNVFFVDHFHDSGGNRRKLSTAVALMGNPLVIFLDEPTTGMDIKARKDFVETLRKIVKQENKSVIVTSHRLAD